MSQALQTRPSTILEAARALLLAQRELEQATAERAALWAALGRDRDPGAIAAVEALGVRIDGLYAQIRALKAHIRSGDPAVIVARARAEERLERQEGRYERAVARAIAA
ncbi:MAG: hypothetical protein R3C15_00170 [Thermoleophilia bacterium]